MKQVVSQGAEGSDGPPARLAGPAAATGPPVVSSSELLLGGRELLIRHGDERYRLLLTARNKLILTK